MARRRSRNLLTEKIGATGGRLHAGRSRNDQVLAALRLYMREAVKKLRAGVNGVADALDQLIRRDGATPLPGYTHTQQAMPSSVVLWAGGYAASCVTTPKACAWRSGASRKIRSAPPAGYGTPNLAGQPRGNAHTARLRDEPGAGHRSAALARQAEAQLLFEDHARHAGSRPARRRRGPFLQQEFAFRVAGAEFTTGSSIMPAEAQSGRVRAHSRSLSVRAACLSESLAITSKLTSGYSPRPAAPEGAALSRHRPVASRRSRSCRRRFAGVHFNKDRIKLDPSIHAAAEANLIVAQGRHPVSRRVSTRRGEVPEVIHGHLVSSLHDRRHLPLRRKTMVEHIGIEITEIRRGLHPRHHAGR